MYGRSRLKVKVDPHSTFPFTRGIHCLYFIYARKFYLLSNGKLRRNGNQPLEKTFGLSELASEQDFLK